ncbi:hypothetical protein AVEN_830-1 [Araneus ventricosus]|uniref:Pre-C2HC domain-containing protein n=1 Tax=Araneus ventricosus TaxID=182803 RepID=A0A4Y2GGC3_ARAVE|nr:hypothetical protein AVEN_830-1 [Araneus ventricosus]
MASRWTTEEIVESIVECGDGISLEDLHIYYGFLAKKEPTELATEWMIKLQAMAANKYGEGTIPGIVRLSDIRKPGKTEQSTSTHFNKPTSISFDLTLETPTNSATNNMEVDSGNNQTAENMESIDILSHSDSSTDTEIEDDAGFKTVARKKRKKSISENHGKGKRTHENTNIKKKSSIPTGNKFSPLANLPSDQNAEQVPPIIIRKFDNFKLLMQRLNEIQKISCAAKPKGEFMHVYCNSSADHRNITEYLDKEKIQYYVVPPAAKKPVKVVIKGLPIDYSIEDIKNNLNKLNFRVDKVNQLKKFKDKRPLNIFQVHLMQSENIQDIYKLTTMEYYIIYVEKYVRKTIGQCFCCQKFAHHSSGCKMEARCVLCAEAHDSRVCPMKNKDNFTPKCANCGGPHTASFRGCPNFTKLEKKQHLDNHTQQHSKEITKLQQIQNDLQ